MRANLFRLTRQSVLIEFFEIEERSRRVSFVAFVDIDYLNLDVLYYIGWFVQRQSFRIEL